MRKKLILCLGISLVCFTAFVLSVRATEKETVSLSNVDGQIEATLELPVEEKGDGSFTPPDDIVALQLSFQISGEGSIRKDDVSFAFSGSLPQGAVQEYRYQEDTGILNIYISGRDNLYNSKNVSLGKVIVNSDEKTTVKVVKDSFKTVNRAHGMYEGEVNTGDGGQTVNNGSSGGNSNGNDDVGEIMRPPEEGGKPNEGNNGSSEGKELTAEEQNGKKNEEKPAAGTTGSAKRILDASLNGITGESFKPSDQGNTDLKNEDSKDDSEDMGPLIPESSLWEDGAKLLREKTGAIDMDVWTKIFFGLFAGSTVAAGGIGFSMAVRASRKRKRRRRRRVQAGGSYASTKRRSQTAHRRSEPPRQSRKPTQERRPQTVRRTQSSRTTAGSRQNVHVRREQPVWKDEKKTYVRKRRKIS